MDLSSTTSTLSHKFNFRFLEARGDSSSFFLENIAEMKARHTNQADAQVRTETSSLKGDPIYRWATIEPEILAFRT